MSVSARKAGLALFPSIDCTIIAAPSRLNGIGRVLVAATTKGVCSVILGDDKSELVAELTERFPKHVITEQSYTPNQTPPSNFSSWTSSVEGALSDPTVQSVVPFDIQGGTEFQLKVWAALQKIPCGSTVTYTELATAIGSKEAVRAVANACGANPIAVLIPCHRVVRADGSLGGYRWGLERKQLLLKEEKEAVAKSL